MRGDLIITDTDYDTFFSSLSDITETVSVSALPTITNAYYNTSGNLLEITSDFTLNKTITAYNAFVIYGANFKYTDSILLSSSTTDSLTTTLTSISSKYTGGTTGYVLQSSYYSILNDNMISLDLSKLTGSGSFNIVVNNPVGWVSTYSINSFTFTKS
jgi:hypothetical protein